MKKSGFSLIEIIISMLILSITGIGSFGLMITANRQVINARHMLQADSQAQAVFEKLRCYVEENPTNTKFNTGLHSPTEIGLSSEPIIPGANSLAWSYVVSTISGSNCKQVDVVVSWEEP